MSLKRRHLVWAAALLALSLAGGCTDLGTPDYSDQVGLRERIDGPVDPFPPVAPDPYQPGEERLSVGYFYEGGRSETIPINTVTTNYFIFVIDTNRPGQTLTGGQFPSSDRLEGLESIEFTTADQPFWGSGILWEEAIDLSEWTTMFVGFKSSDDSFERIDLTLQSATTLPNEPPPAPNGVTIDVRTYGYTNNGEWHFLEIPLQDFIDRGWDASNARSPFIMGGPTVRAGDQLLIDNLYFTKDVVGAGGTGGTGGTGGIGGTGGSEGEVVYAQDFNTLDIDGTFLGDGWKFFVNVFEGDGTFRFGYGGTDAPNGPQISALVDDQGGPDQQPQQLSVYSDYECCAPDLGHRNGTDLVETNVFEERTIGADDVGKTFTFSFQAKAGNIEGNSTANAFIKTLDPADDFSVSAIATQDTTNLPTTWGDFTISLEITQDQVDHLLQFGFQTNASNSEGSGNFYDNVVVTKKPTAAEVVYAQDFNTLDIDGTFLGDGWKFFVNVFEGDGTVRFGYGGTDAPNGPQISALVDDQGGPDQQPQQLSVYSDYECCAPDLGHRNGTDLVETNVFEERTIGADDIGKTFTFSFQAKAGNIEGSSTANAFIKTLDPADDFSVSAIATQDTTNLPTTWGDFTISLEITQDQVDHLLQFGFQTNASNSEGSGNFYDNVVVTK